MPFTGTQVIKFALVLKTVSRHSHQHVGSIQLQYLYSKHAEILLVPKSYCNLFADLQMCYFLNTTCS